MAFSARLQNGEIEQDSAGSELCNSSGSERVVFVVKGMTYSSTTSMAIKATTNYQILLLSVEHVIQRYTNF